MNEQHNEQISWGKDRDSLKKAFEDGSFPSGEDFAALIDSTLNLQSDGFRRTMADGFQIAQKDDDGKLISFSEVIGDPQYWMRIGSNQNLLFVSDREDGHDFVFMREGPESRPEDASAGQVRVGINVFDPTVDLDVGGTVRSGGRIGVGREQQEFEARADGEWHSVTEDLTGCRGFELIAGLGGQPGEGRYALTHAVALNTYHPSGWLFNFLKLKRGLRVTNAYYRSRAEKIRVRWHSDGGKGTDRKYWLQIKTNGNLVGKDKGEAGQRDDLVIRYYLTKLWFDDDMTGSRRPTGGAEASAAETKGAETKGAEAKGDEAK